VRDFTNTRVVGRCSQCGGVVSVPTVFLSVVPPVPTCEQCGAVMNRAANLPVVPTVPMGQPRGDRWFKRFGSGDDPREASGTFCCSH